MQGLLHHNKTTQYIVHNTHCTLKDTRTNNTCLTVDRIPVHRSSKGTTSAQRFHTMLYTTTSGHTTSYCVYPPPTTRARKPRWPLTCSVNALVGRLSYLSVKDAYILKRS